VVNAQVPLVNAAPGSFFFRFGFTAAFFFFAM